jgi:hypothetical protein
MANDYQKKQPTKNEKAIYDIIMHAQMLERNIWSNSAHVVALSMLLDVDPEKVAETLVNGQSKIEEYGKKINEAIDRLETAKKEKLAEGAKTEGEIKE